MSKRLKWFTLLAISGAVTFFVLRWLVQRASPMPANLGVENGRLAPCPPSPNCVSTQAPDEEQEHSIAPIAYEGKASAAHASILAILQADAQFTIITNTPNYIHAEAKSNLWQFIDDVEFFFDEADSHIHFRSASRLGYGDRGVNRQRMEAIRAEFKAES